jgi:HEAT repeat protein
MTSRVARHGVLARCGAGGGVWLALLIACATGFLACGTPASVHAATPQDAVAMAFDMISSADPDMRAIGLDRLRHSLRGSEATLKVAAMLSGLPAEQQKELVRAFATRGDAAAIPAITALVLATPDAAVRAAALEGLGGLGSGTEVALLKKWLAEGEPEKSAARRGLRLLRGADVSTQLVEAAHFGEPALRPTFIDILAERGEAGVAATLAALAADPEPAVRLAALKALAKLGGSAEAAPLVDRLLAATANDERAEAERTLVTLCTVNRGKEGATKVFLERFKGAGENTQEKLLPALGRIGGPEALAIVDELIAASDTAKRGLGLKALTRWPDATVAGRLIDLHGKSTDAAERESLLGALIRVAPLPDNKIKDGEKLDLLQKAMALCEKDQDRTRILERANAIRTVETFRFVLPYLDDPTFAESACLSVVELAHHQKLRDAHKDEFAKALDKVIATTKNQELVERASRYKEGKTWERKKS